MIQRYVNLVLIIAFILTICVHLNYARSIHNFNTPHYSTTQNGTNVDIEKMDNNLLFGLLKNKNKAHIVNSVNHGKVNDYTTKVTNPKTLPADTNVNNGALSLISQHLSQLPQDNNNQQQIIDESSTAAVSGVDEDIVLAHHDDIGRSTVLITETRHCADAGFSICIISFSPPTDLHEVYVFENGSFNIALEMPQGWITKPLISEGEVNHEGEDDGFDFSLKVHSQSVGVCHLGRAGNHVELTLTFANAGYGITCVFEKHDHMSLPPTYSALYNISFPALHYYPEGVSITPVQGHAATCGDWKSNRMCHLSLEFSRAVDSFVIDSSNELLSFECPQGIEIITNTYDMYLDELTPTVMHNFNDLDDDGEEEKAKVKFYKYDVFVDANVYPIIAEDIRDANGTYITTRSELLRCTVMSTKTSQYTPYLKISKYVTNGTLHLDTHDEIKQYINEQVVRNELSPFKSQRSVMYESYSVLYTRFDISQLSDCILKSSSICTLEYTTPRLQQGNVTSTIGTTPFNVIIPFFVSAFDNVPIFESTDSRTSLSKFRQRWIKPVTTAFDPLTNTTSYMGQPFSPVHVYSIINKNNTNINTGNVVTKSDDFKLLSIFNNLQTSVSIQYMIFNDLIQITYDQGICGNAATPICRIYYHTTYSGYKMRLSLKGTPFQRNIKQIDNIQCHGNVTMIDSHTITFADISKKDDTALNDNANHMITPLEDYGEMYCSVDFVLPYGDSSPSTNLLGTGVGSITHDDFFISEYTSYLYGVKQQVQVHFQLPKLPIVDYHFQNLPFTLELDPICNLWHRNNCTMYVKVSPHNEIFQNATTIEEKTRILQQSYLRPFTIPLYNLRAPDVQRGETYDDIVQVYHNVPNSLGVVKDLSFEVNNYFTYDRQETVTTTKGDVINTNAIPPSQRFMKFTLTPSFYTELLQYDTFFPKRVVRNVTQWNEELQIDEIIDQEYEYYDIVFTIDYLLSVPMYAEEPAYIDLDLGVPQNDNSTPVQNIHNIYLLDYDGLDYRQPYEVLYPITNVTNNDMVIRYEALFITLFDTVTCNNRFSTFCYLDIIPTDKEYLVNNNETLMAEWGRRKYAPMYLTQFELTIDTSYFIDIDMKHSRFIKNYTLGTERVIVDNEEENGDETTTTNGVMEQATTSIIKNTNNIYSHDENDLLFDVLQQEEPSQANMLDQQVQQQKKKNKQISQHLKYYFNVDESCSRAANDTIRISFIKRLAITDVSDAARVDINRLTGYFHGVPQINALGSGIVINTYQISQNVDNGDVNADGDVYIDEYITMPLPSGHTFALTGCYYDGDVRWYGDNNCADHASEECTLHINMYTNEIYPNTTLMKVNIPDLSERMYSILTDELKKEQTDMNSNGNGNLTPTTIDYRQLYCTNILGEDQYESLHNVFEFAFNVTNNDVTIYAKSDPALYHAEYYNEDIPLRYHNQTIYYTNSLTTNDIFYTDGNNNNNINGGIQCQFTFYKKPQYLGVSLPTYPSILNNINYNEAPYNIYPIPSAATVSSVAVIQQQQIIAANGGMISSSASTAITTVFYRKFPHLQHHIFEAIPQTKCRLPKSDGIECVLDLKLTGSAQHPLNNIYIPIPAYKALQNKLLYNLWFEGTYITEMLCDATTHQVLPNALDIIVSELQPYLEQFNVTDNYGITITKGGDAQLVLEYQINIDIKNNNQVFKQGIGRFQIAAPICGNFDTVLSQINNPNNDGVYDTTAPEFSFRFFIQNNKYSIQDTIAYINLHIPLLYLNGLKPDHDIYWNQDTYVLPQIKGLAFVNHNFTPTYVLSNDEIKYGGVPSKITTDMFTPNTFELPRMLIGRSIDIQYARRRVEKESIVPITLTFFQHHIHDIEIAHVLGHWGIMKQQVTNNKNDQKDIDYNNLIVIDPLPCYQVIDVYDPDTNQTIKQKTTNIFANLTTNLQTQTTWVQVLDVEYTAGSSCVFDLPINVQFHNNILDHSISHIIYSHLHGDRPIYALFSYPRYTPTAQIRALTGEELEYHSTGSSATMVTYQQSSFLVMIFVMIIIMFTVI